MTEGRVKTVSPDPKPAVRIFRPIPVESLKLLVFDLDGTLIDSAQDLCNSVNAALRHFGLKAIPDKTIAGFIGNGAPMLMRRSLAYESGIPVSEVSEESLVPSYAFFLENYLSHDLDFTYAYNGVRESLEALSRRNPVPQRTLAVLTNKPTRPAQEILKGLGIASYFRRIYGGDSFSVKKPDPRGLFSLMGEINARPDETVMIGDSKVDVQTARSAGAWSLGCAFGFGPQDLMDDPPDVVVSSAQDWERVLDFP